MKDRSKSRFCTFGVGGFNAKYIKSISSDRHTCIVDCVEWSRTRKETNGFRQISSHIVSKIWMYFVEMCMNSNLQCLVLEFALELLMAANFLDC
uniref:Uncharacterized protein n=1 Tax=Salvator merianae TaxID=96440 RepID=A0A8D0B3S1_SALMN